jgi:hypothetical protein
MNAGYYTINNFVICINYLVLLAQWNLSGYKRLKSGDQEMHTELWKRNEMGE